MASPPAVVALTDQGSLSAVALKDQGDEELEAGNYLKAAALYTQAIKLDPDNATLYRNRAAAFLQLVKLRKALQDANTTFNLKPDWEKGAFLEKEFLADPESRANEASADDDYFESLYLFGQDAFLEKDLLDDPKSRGEEAFANGNYCEALYLDGLDLPPPLEEIAVDGSGGIGGEGLRSRRGLLDMLEETFKYSGRGGGGLVLEETFKYCDTGGGGLLDILDQGVDHMVVPIKLCSSHGWGGERFIMSPLKKTGSIFGRKFPAEQGQAPWSLKKFWDILKPKTRRQPVKPKPYPRNPRAEDKIGPKPISKIYQLCMDIRNSWIRFLGYLRTQVPIAILIICGFVAATGSTICIWCGRNESFVVNFTHPGKKIVLVADDIFSCQNSRLELMKVCNLGICNLGTCDIVIPMSAIHYLESRHVGVECLKTAPALLLIKNLLEAKKVKILQDPMDPDYKENMLKTVLILKLMYPGAVVTIATNNKFLRS